ncbi:hypothetical protein FRC11_003455, partial [Ceratobasidium sp. 423]
SPSPTVSRQTEERVLVRDETPFTPETPPTFETPPTLETLPTPEPPTVPATSHHVRVADPNKKVVAPKGRAKPAKARKSKQKDPNRPKQPPGGFILFQKETRESLRAQFPGISLMELVKIMAANWKALPEGKRKWYTNRAMAEVEQWKVRMCEYNQSLTMDTPDPPSGSGTEKSPTPKRRRIDPTSDEGEAA